MIRDLLTKKPFVRVQPSVSLRPVITGYIDKAPDDTGANSFISVPQSDFICELHPSGHKINSPLYYPDKIKYDEQNKRYFTQKVIRTAFPFQRIILVQQLVHLCGNDIHIESTNSSISEQDTALTLELKKGWLDKNMEIAFYELARSVKATGDGAVAMCISGRKASYRSFSFLYGDRLYPHFAPYGSLDCFARRYRDLDDTGRAVTEWVEVWDSRNLSRYKRSLTGAAAAVSSLKDFLGIDGYSLVSSEPHGFLEVPVVYQRDDNGPCWSDSQDPIDKFELAVSHLCQNNMAYAFPIMILKGEDVTVQGDIYGDVKCITMDGEDSDAKYLAPQDASNSFTVQLNTLLKMIFMGSFIVEPPEIKSGDLPGVAIKLIYSPSLEKAIIDAKEFDKSVDKLLRLFKFAYGVEIGKVTQLTNLCTFSWIEPYVHQNAAELVNNLCMLANSQLISRSTGSGLTGYGENDEYDKIMREYKEAQASDLLNSINLDTATSANADGANTITDDNADNGSNS